jgi:plastocyanin
MSNYNTFLLSIFLISTHWFLAGKTTPRTHRIEIKDMKFIPAEVTVQKGDTIVWINNDFVVHDVSETTKKAWKTSPIPVGKTWKVVAQQSVAYFCSFHPIMKGKINVK